ncbi:MAG: SDR family NAD(P)-dependent oxidoreductase [Thermoguttaceae bacterium]
MIKLNKQRVVLVTGASRGLGAAIAKRLGKDGFRVAVNYFNSQKRADEVVKEIVDNGGMAMAFKADVTQERDVKQLINEITATWGNVEILINNATGPQPDLPIEEYTWKDFEDQINFFIKAPFMLMQELIGPMKEARWGKIINIGSEVAEDCRPNFSAYVTAKCAMLGLTRTWALEFAPWNIAVNLIAPGWIPTERHKDQQAKLEQYRARIPMGHHGVPEDVASAVSFLAAEETTFISGQRLSVNGAFTF